jgi:hypothetical protein
MCWLLPACIVTDEIEFQLAVNRPVRITDTFPSADSVQAVAAGAKYTLTVFVRDPDIMGQSEPQLEAQIALSLSPYAPDFENPDNRNPACGPPLLLGKNPLDEEQGSVYQIECLVDLADRTLRPMLSPGDLLLARVLVSDLGFVSGAVPKSATTAVARWALRVAEANE